MTKRLKVCLMIVLAALCLACVAVAGCKVGRPSREDETKGYNIHVVYYANGGRFDGMDIYVRELYHKCNEGESSVAFFNITPDSESSKVAFSDYDFVGWYFPETYSGGEHDGEIVYSYTANGKTVPAYVKLDSDGNIVLDSEARPLYVAEGVTGDVAEKYIKVTPSQRAVPENYMIADDSDISVCAVWKPSLKVLYKLVCEEGKTYTDADGKSYTNGAILDERSFGNSNIYAPIPTAPKALNGATFAKSFLNEGLTEEIQTITRPEGVDGADPEPPVVYCHYIDGADWNVITSADQAAKMFGALDEGKKYYLYNDVNLAGRKVAVNNNKDTTSTIVGNGKTISNIKVTVTSGAPGSKYSLLGNVKAEACISDITFKDITFDVTARRGGSIDFYAIFLSLDSGAQISGVKIDGVDAKVNAAGGVRNIPDFDNPTNWLFGGLALGTTDSDFLAANAQKITSVGENKVAK